ncbi:MAG: hypothetical protein JXA03_01715 [Bacteroidales bacterium]|nr:hypothetical protein [Bacteroidales bacterium]
MKVIISHDIDHLTVREHLRDPIIPKFLIRAHIELLSGMISPNEYKRRFRSFFRNKWQNLDEMIHFDKEHGVASTFFAGTVRGLGLSYRTKDLGPWVKRILSEGFDMGVHGIAFNDVSGMKQEYSKFKKLTGLKEFGIRMHYLRRGGSTADLINKTGYLFDSGIYGLKAPYKEGGFWEFPLHIMDTYEFQQRKPWQDSTLEEAKEATDSKIRQAIDLKLPFLTILMHDFYFSDGFKAWKEWYIWLIKRLKADGFSFVNFKTAIRDMEAAEKNANQPEMNNAGDI